MKSMVPKHFFHRQLACILMHKENWIKKIIPAWRSIHPKAATSAKICQNSSKNIDFLRIPIETPKSITFWVFNDNPKEIWIFK